MFAHRSSLIAGASMLLIVLGCVSASAQQSAESEFASLGWEAGPTTGRLGNIASIQVPSGYRFVGAGGASKFMELLQNPSDGRELGVLIKDDASWFVVFQFADDGYVRDDDRDLDPDAILESIRTGTEQANEIRRERGWDELHVVGWQQEPFYDAGTHNLTWSIRGRSAEGDSINHSTRVLGRRGVMHVDLVLGPEDIGEAVPQFNGVMTGFTFNPGERYSEFRRGDKVAQYGLTGLIVGGAGVALMKTGFLQKFWKLIVIAFVALAGAVKRAFAGMRRGGNARSEQGV